jgi:peptide deformylase
MTKLKGKAKARASRKNKNKQKDAFFLRRKMLLGEIKKYDDPALSVKCEIVPEGEDVKDIFKKMAQVMNAAKNGVGIAASQIGESKKLIVIKSDSDSHQITYMINPEIISKSDQIKLGREGCLSYPETYAFIERFAWVEISYFDQNWKEHTTKYKEGDILGIVAQHEIEHLEYGHCQIYEWWKDPEGKKKELEAKFKKPEEKEEQSSGYEIVESEDYKREQEEQKVEK